MKKLVVFLIVLVLAAGYVACGGGSSPTSPNQPVASTPTPGGPPMPPTPTPAY